MICGCPVGGIACRAPSDACRPLASVRCCWGPQGCCSSASCARRCVGAALSLPQARSLWALAPPQPDVLVAGDGQTAAFRGNDGRLAVLRTGRDTFAIKEWLAADADARTPKDGSLGNGVTCDAVGCIGRLGDSRLISMVAGDRGICRGLRASGSGGLRPRVAASTAMRCWLIARSGNPTARSRYAGRATVLRRRSRFRVARTGHGRIAREPFPRMPSPCVVSRHAGPSRIKTILRRTISSGGKALRACPEYARGSAAESGPRRRYWQAQAQLKRRGGESA